MMKNDANEEWHFWYVSITTNRVYKTYYLRTLKKRLTKREITDVEVTFGKPFVINSIGYMGYMTNEEFGWGDKV